MLSGPVLIARGLDLKTGASRYGVLKVCGDTPLTTFGGHSDGGTPLPIPNREVKPVSADGTRRATSRESRTPPNLERPPRAGVRLSRLVRVELRDGDLVLRPWTEADVPALVEA